MSCSSVIRTNFPSAGQADRRRHEPILNGIVGGWRTNGIWRFNSGRPIDPMLYSSHSLPTYGPQRPNLIGTPHRAGGKDSDWIQQYFTSIGRQRLPGAAGLLRSARRLVALGKVRNPGATMPIFLYSRSLAWANCAKERA
jgi:hypothetical protein